MSASKKDTSKKNQPADTDNAAETVDDSVADNVAVDPRLLEVIICPKTRGPLSYDKDAQELISKRAKLAYPIRNGVPVMLVNEARKL